MFFILQVWQELFKTENCFFIFFFGFSDEIVDNILGNLLNILSLIPKGDGYVLSRSRLIPPSCH